MTLEWCAESDLLGTCVSWGQIADLTDEAGRYALTRNTDCYSDQLLGWGSRAHTLSAQIYIDDYTYINDSESGVTGLRCTEEVQLFDFSASLVLVLSGHVTRLEGSLSPHTRVQLWREGEAVPNRSHEPAADGSYRLGFADCYVVSGDGNRYFVQAVDPVNHLSSERSFITSCEPKYQTTNLLLEPE